MAKDKGIKGALNSFVNPQLLNKKQSKTAERYGINPQDYAFGRPGGGGIQKKDPRQFSSDVAAAAMGDYDTRRTMEAAAMSGHSKAEQYAKGGFETMEDVTKANNIMRRMHSQAGNGGDFSSASDFAGVTFAQVNKDRDNFAKQFATQDDLTAMQKVEKVTKANDGPVELSSRAQAAIDAQDYSFEPTKRGLGNPNVAYDPNGGIDSKKAGSFMNNYKKDIQTGISKTGTPGRGPQSLHNRF
jgi:hypothetical protein